MAETKDETQFPLGPLTNDGVYLEVGNSRLRKAHGECPRTHSTTRSVADDRGKDRMHDQADESSFRRSSTSTKPGGFQPVGGKIPV